MKLWRWLLELFLEYLHGFFNREFQSFDTCVVVNLRKVLLQPLFRLQVQTSKLPAVHMLKLVFKLGHVFVNHVPYWLRVFFGRVLPYFMPIAIATLDTEPQSSPFSETPALFRADLRNHI